MERFGPIFEKQLKNHGFFSIIKTSVKEAHERGIHMSDWGLVGFSYDYERIGRHGEPERVKGVVSKAYKYADIRDMVRHAFNGFRYFLQRYDHRYFNFGIDNAYSSWEELNTAFDVFFEQYSVAPGHDQVSYVVNDWLPDKEEKDSEKELEYRLFGCEGTCGWFFINFTGNPTDGYKTKYGFNIHEKVLEVDEAIEEYYSDIEERYDQNDDSYKKMMENKDDDMAMAIYFNENATPVQSEEDFWRLQDLGVTIIREIIENGPAVSDQSDDPGNNGVISDEDSIDRLVLSVRAFNCLMRAGVKTVGELKSMTPEELESIRNMGKKGALEVVQKLQELENQ